MPTTNVSESISLEEAKEIADHPENHTTVDIVRAIDVLQAIYTYLGRDKSSADLLEAEARLRERINLGRKVYTLTNILIGIAQTKELLQRADQKTHH